MKIICVEEHATDPATDEAARPAILGEAPYFGLMDSANAACAPRNDHRPTMVALPEALELAADIGDGRIKHMDEQGIQLTGWGWHHEAGVHVLRLILSGAFEKYPGLQVISGHWGEMVPFYLHRLDDMLPPSVTGLSRTITETYLNHVWVTPSGLFDLPHFQFIYTVIGADRIIWSVDYPYLTLDGTREFLGTLPVSEQDLEKITHLNAEKLFTLSCP